MKTKQILLGIAATFIVGAIVTSCMTGDLLVPKVILSPEVLDAQRWFEKQEANSEGIRIILFNEKRATASWPDWDLTFSEENDRYKFLGVYLSKTVPKKRTIRKKEDGTEEQEMYMKDSASQPANARESSMKRGIHAIW